MLSATSATRALEEGKSPTFLLLCVLMLDLEQSNVLFNALLV